jgi:hypothetical protein
MRFITTEYEFSHGRKPRGRGLWMFVFLSYDLTTGKSRTLPSYHNGTYTEAKKAFRARFGNSALPAEVHVCP